MRSAIAGLLYFVFRINASSKTRAILNQHVPYYRNLSNPDKDRFSRRVACFVMSKSFIGKKGLHVTKEMKVLSASPLVMITFGMNHPVLSQFERIFLFPSAFYSHHGKAYHKGEVNPMQRYIAFSWEDLKASYEKQKPDGQHLGLHEMAHVVKLQNLMSNEEYDAFFKRYFQKWRIASKDKMDKVQKGENTFLRRYAGTNEHEFFAVSVEEFFTRPREFREKLPNLYNEMCFLLNQNPLSVAGGIRNARKLFRKKMEEADGKMHTPGREKMAFKSMSLGAYLAPMLPGLIPAFIMALIFLLGAQIPFLQIFSIIVAIFAGILMLLLTGYRTFRFRENCLQMSTPLVPFHGGECIPYEQIVYVWTGKKQGHIAQMEVAYYLDNQVQKKKFNCNISPKNTEKMEQLLQKKEVPVR